MQFWALISVPLLLGFGGATPSYGQRPWTSDYTPDYVLVATAENVTINCLSRYSVIFNGTVPGPPLHMKENSTTWVRVYNHIQNQNLTVHWHGLSQRADIFSDGTPQVSQWPIAPWNYFDYAITPQIGDAGSYFYHSHVGFQAVTAGGVIIVEDDIRTGPRPYSYDHDISLFFQDFYHKNDSVIEKGLVANPFVWSGEPEAILLNGKTGNQSFTNATHPSCTPEIIKVIPGKTYRMRFINNAAISFIALGFEDHDNLTIIEADGEYTKPWETDRIQIGSGQRFSIVFQAKSALELQSLNKTQFWLRYESRDRPTNVTGYALLKYDTGAPVALPSSLPATPPVILPRDRQNITTWSEYSLTSLNPSESFPPLSSVTRTVTITMRQAVRDGIYNGSFYGVVQWTENGLAYQTESAERNNTIPYLVQVYTLGQTPNYTAAVANNGWDPTDNNHAFPALVGEVLDIVWLSNSGPSGGWDFHPMHAHGAHYWDLGSGNGTYNATENEKHFSGGYGPAKRDTTILHRYATSGVPQTTAGWRAWRLRVTEENVGAWMMHCHILAHMAMGMQTVWVFGDAASILARFPTAPYVNGYLAFGGDAYGNASYDPFSGGGYT